MIPPSEPDEPASARSADVALQDADIQALFPGERAFVDIASREPAFAGTFLDGGVLVANVSDPASRGAVTAEVEGLLLPDVQRRGRAMGGVEIRDVRYSFLELANWRNLAWRHVMSLEDVTSLDLDERGNRVRIGLATGAGSTGVAQVLDSLGIPSEATTIEVTGPAVPSVLIEEPKPPASSLVTYLWNRIRPIPGGVRFDWANPPDSSSCTLGFNARRWPGGDHHFITASHCGYVFGLDPGSTEAFQRAPDTIGSESVDPEGWSCSWPWEPNECRYSDAAAYAYRPGIVDSLDFGTIARPEGPPGTGSSQGNTVIDANNPRFHITGAVNWPQDGDSVHKVGYVGGWTKGKVYESCSGINVEEKQPNPGYRVTCGYRAYYRSDPGDSGGPVFIRTDPTEVVLAGVNFGSNSSGNGIFSSFGAIFHVYNDNLFSQVQVWDAPLQGGITGPLEAPPEVECTWYASNVSGGVWPYTYQWSGALTGTQMNVTGEIQAPGEWLYLTVTDAASNQLNDQLHIPVDDEAEECEF